MSLVLYKQNLLSDINKLKTVLSRDQIIAIQHDLERLGVSTELPKANVFLSEGVYFRELTIPANRLVIGATHKQEHLFMVLKGKAKVVSNYETVIANAGYISKALPFSKRLVWTYEETTFANIHSNPLGLEDLDDLYNYYVDEDKLDIVTKRIEGEKL